VEKKENNHMALIKPRPVKVIEKPKGKVITGSDLSIIDLATSEIFGKACEILLKEFQDVTTQINNTPYQFTTTTEKAAKEFQNAARQFNIVYRA
jgi:hypothetical protein